MERPCQINNENLAPFSMLRFPFLSALFIIRTETIGGESHIRQHAPSPTMKKYESSSNTPRKISEDGNMRPAKNPLSNFHYCCLSMVPGTNITLSGATSSLPVPPREASSLCWQQTRLLCIRVPRQPSTEHAPPKAMELDYDVVNQYCPVPYAGINQCTLIDMAQQSIFGYYTL